MSRIRAWVCTVLFVPEWLFAESAQPQSFTPPPSVISTENMLQLSAGLLMVLAFIALIAWLFKKIGIPTANKSGILKIIASANIGQRERIVLTEVDGIRLVLGVAPGHVSLLHRIQREATPVSEATNATSASSFPEKLQTNLKQCHGKSIAES